MKIISALPFGLILLLASCVSKDFDRAQVADIKEFDNVVKIEKIEEPTPSEPVEEKKEIQEKPSKKKKASQAKKEKAKEKQVVKSPVKVEKGKKEKVKPVPEKDKKEKQAKRRPPLEDDEGFDGRRPEVDPFRVGEEIVLGVSYFGVEAGKFTMKVMPMVQVNGKKSYHFRYIIKTSPLFNLVYSVNDVAETFVDYETLLPHHYEIHVDESKQVRETKTFFDHQTNKATMWDQKQKSGGKLEKRKVEWDLLKYSQNVFSAGYYLRNFTLKVGKKLKVRVGHEGKNIIMTAEVIRRETIFTDAGKFDTFVVKPEFQIEGKFKPTGENFLWLTADDRKFIVKLESKIKIGSLIGEVQKIKKQ